MRLLCVAWEQLLEKKGMILLMIVELTLTLIAFTVFASQTANLFALASMYESIPANRVWASDSHTMESEEAEGSALPEGVLSIRCGGAVVLLPSGEKYNMNKDNPTVYLWPQSYYQQFTLELRKGNWMTDPKEGYLNILVPHNLTHRYAAGKTYSTMVWYETDSGYGETREMDVYVCGALADSMIPTPTGGVDYDKTGILGLDLTGMLKVVPYDNPSYWLFETIPLDKEQKTVMDSLAWPLEENMKYQQESMTASLRLPIVLSIALLCFCLSAFLGYNLLNMLDKEKRIAIYFLCGARTRDVIGMKLTHDAILIGFPMLLSLAGLGWFSHIGMIPSVSLLGVVFSYLFVMLIFGLSSFLFIRQINQRSIVSYIHRWL